MRTTGPYLLEGLEQSKLPLFYQVLNYKTQRIRLPLTSSIPDDGNPGEISMRLHFERMKRKTEASKGRAHKRKAWRFVCSTSLNFIGFIYMDAVPVDITQLHSSRDYFTTKHRHSKETERSRDTLCCRYLPTSVYLAHLYYLHTAAGSAYLLLPTYLCTLSFITVNR